MRVYVVLEQHFFAGGTIVKIFSKEADADDHVAELADLLTDEQKPEYDEWGHCGGIQYSVVEHEVE